MSRRKPVSYGPTGEVRPRGWRPHPGEMAAADGERRTPWPYLTQKQGAKRLNVSVEWLSGLANQEVNGVVALRAVRIDGRSESLLAYNRDDVLNLRARMGGEP